MTTGALPETRRRQPAGPREQAAPGGPRKEAAPGGPRDKEAAPEPDRPREKEPSPEPDDPREEAPALAPARGPHGAAPSPRVAGGPREQAPSPAPAGGVPLLFVITTTDFGGTENFVEQLVAGLDRRRFSPIVCSLCPPGRAGQRIAGAGVPVESLGMSARPLPHQLLAGAWRLARLCERRQVALVHALLYRANVVAAAACRLARRRPVLIWGQHSQIATSEGWWAATAARFCRPAADRIVAVAEAVKESLAAAERIPRDRIAVIGNGVDAERFRPAWNGQAAARNSRDRIAVLGNDVEAGRFRPARNGLPGAPYGSAGRAAGGALGNSGGRAERAVARARLGLEPEAMVVGAVGRLAPEKGLPFLLEAVALGRARGLPLALVLVGDGPDRASLEREAERRGIAAHARFLGFQRHLESLYPAFDVFAMPSLEEASPMALLEAMACGCAIVASAVGGVPEILAGGRCGLLVEPASPGALARAFAQLAAEPGLRRHVAAEARARILADYDLPAMIRRHEQLYLSLLPQAGR
ncbi:MAG: glycosyltransferase [Acidobacteria bacterium]|nr:glycosyltransferase [Acidobacteriota bacterium]